MPAPRVIDTTRNEPEPSALPEFFSNISKSYKDESDRVKIGNILDQYKQHRNDVNAFENMQIQLESSDISPSRRIQSQKSMNEMKDKLIERDKQLNQSAYQLMKQQNELKKQDKEEEKFNYQRSRDEQRDLREEEKFRYQKEKDERKEQRYREIASREKTLAGDKPIEPEQLKIIQRVTSTRDYQNASIADQHQMLLENGVSTKNTNAITEAKFKQEKVDADRDPDKKEYEKRRGISVSNFVEDAFSEAKKASEFEYSLGMAEMAANGQVTGPGATAILKDNHIGQLFAGLTPDESMLQVAVKQLLEGSKGIFGNTPTEKEIFTLLNSMLPSIGKSKEANRAAINALRDLNKFKVERSEIVSQITDGGRNYVPDLESKVVKDMGEKGKEFIINLKEQRGEPLTKEEQALKDDKQIEVLAPDGETTGYMSRKQIAEAANKGVVFTPTDESEQKQQYSEFGFVPANMNNQQGQMGGQPGVDGVPPTVGPDGVTEIGPNGGTQASPIGPDGGQPPIQVGPQDGGPVQPGDTGGGSGFLDSINYGIQETLATPLALAEKAKSGLEYLSKPFVKPITDITEKGMDQLYRKVRGKEPPKRPQTKTVSKALSDLPKSETKAGRFVRTSIPSVAYGSGIGFAVGGPPGALAGAGTSLIGNLAGQTYREIFGKDGEMESTPGEVGAIAVDVVASLSAGLVPKLPQLLKQSRKIPNIFSENFNRISNKITKSYVQGEKKVLDKVIKDFSDKQIAKFEKEATRVSAETIQDLPKTSTQTLKNQAEELYRSNNLDMISPINTTKREAGLNIQEVAKNTFKETVIDAEREAYSKARGASKNLKGEAPEGFLEAKKLIRDMKRKPPSAEEKGVISYLDDVISTVGSKKEVKKVDAETLIDLVQRGNKEINYNSQHREISHRLKPVVANLREDLREILSKDKNAHDLYIAANDLHAKNADIWGTRYMRNVRFSENPETIISGSRKASNMTNIQNAIPDQPTQNLLQRQVVEDITSGSTKGAKKAIDELSPVLSDASRVSSNNLINIKDTLTDVGQRMATKNEILKIASKSVNTGERPEKLLNLMENQKGYNLVAESLNSTPEGRKIFDATKRMFVEDVFNEVMDKNGVIDFIKARKIIKNDDTKKVLEAIGGEGLTKRFSKIEKYAENFQNNMDLYKSNKTQTAMQEIIKTTKNSGLLTGVLYSLGLPHSVVAGFGLSPILAKGGKISYDKAMTKVLTNPKSANMLENLSKATTQQDLLILLPKFVKLLDSIEKD